MRKIENHNTHEDEEFLLLHTEQGELLGYCECCGIEVYESDGGLSVNESGDIIHSSCWDYYAADHVDMFTSRLEGRSGGNYLC